MANLTPCETEKRRDRLGDFLGQSDRERGAEPPFLTLHPLPVSLSGID